MKALNWYGKGDLRYEDFEAPEIAEDQVLLQVGACGVCGSDLPRYFQTGSYDMPKILGHEFMGSIAKCGGSVKKFEVGDRAAVIPLMPCGQCSYCQSEMYFHCHRYSFLGSRAHGGWAEYVGVPSRNAVPLPDSVDFGAGAVMMCLSQGLTPI